MSSQKKRIPVKLKRAYANLSKREGKWHGVAGIRRDMALKGKKAPSYKAWQRAPNRYDWPGIDQGTKKPAPRKKKKAEEAAVVSGPAPAPPADTNVLQRVINAVSQIFSPNPNPQAPAPAAPMAVPYYDNRDLLVKPSQDNRDAPAVLAVPAYDARDWYRPTGQPTEILEDWSSIPFPGYQPPPPPPAPSAPPVPVAEPVDEMEWGELPPPPPPVQAAPSLLQRAFETIFPPPPPPPPPVISRPRMELKMKRGMRQTMDKGRKVKQLAVEEVIQTPAIAMAPPPARKPKVIVPRLNLPPSPVPLSLTGPTISSPPPSPRVALARAPTQLVEGVKSIPLARQETVLVQGPKTVQKRSRSYSTTIIPSASEVASPEMAEEIKTAREMEQDEEEGSKTTRMMYDEEEDEGMTTDVATEPYESEELREEEQPLPLKIVDVEPSPSPVPQFTSKRPTFAMVQEKVRAEDRAKRETRLEPKKTDVALNRQGRSREIEEKRKIRRRTEQLQRRRGVEEFV